MIHDPAQLGFLALAVVGGCGSALCSGIESAAYWVDRLRVGILASPTSHRPPLRAAVTLQRELERPDRLLATILIGNNSFNYLFTVGVAGLLEPLQLAAAAAIGLNLLVVTPLLLVFSESLPKEVFRLRANHLAFVVAAPVSLLRRLLTITGVLPLVLAISQLVQRATGRKSAAATTARQRILRMVADAAGRGPITGRQADILERALSLGRTSLAELMTPLADIPAIRSTTPRDQVLRAIASSAKPFSLCVTPAGKLEGVALHVDVLTQPDAPLPSLLRPPARLPEETSLLQAIALIAQAPAHVGVVERKGKPLGLVTIHDLVQPLLARPAAVGPRT